MLNVGYIHVGGDDVYVRFFYDTNAAPGPSQPSGRDSSGRRQAAALSIE